MSFKNLFFFFKNQYLTKSFKECTHRKPLKRDQCRRSLVVKFGNLTPLRSQNKVYMPDVFYEVSIDFVFFFQVQVIILFYSSLHRKCNISFLKHITTSELLICIILIILFFSNVYVFDFFLNGVILI